MVHGFLYSTEDIGMLKKILLQAISTNGLSPLAQRIASAGSERAKNLMVSNTIHSYASLLENVIRFPSEVAFPKSPVNISSKLKAQWQWHLFENSTVEGGLYKSSTSHGILDKIEERWNQTNIETSVNASSRIDEAFSLIDWEKEKLIEMVNARKRLEEEEVR